ncbi:Holliday junction branch migration protein RuvA [Oscillospiraceae bacterium HV4-5-C5C]|nr:Holliday junction branch migration protein RuvA [Oscillospiraceae bacterium HV4-5-C5C]
MFAYIKGRYAYAEGETLVIENQGLGYLVRTAAELLPRFGRPGDEITCYTSLVIRENELAIYGFPDREGVTLFELLQSVNGIGPKVASLIIGHFRPDELALAVLAGDIKALTQVKGLGKKGAERLVLELKDKLKKAGFEESSLSPGVSAGLTELAPEELADAQTADVMRALLVLGYSSQAAASAVKTAYQAEASLESNIKNCLRSLSQA